MPTYTFEHVQPDADRIFLAAYYAALVVQGAEHPVLMDAHRGGPVARPSSALADVDLGKLDAHGFASSHSEQSSQAISWPPSTVSTKYGTHPHPTRHRSRRRTQERVKTS